MRRIAVAVSTIALSACSFFFPNNKQYVGHSVRDLYEKKGPPDQVIPDPSCEGCTLHIYRSSTTVPYKEADQRVMHVDPLTGAMSTQTITGASRDMTVSDRTVFYVDKSGIVTKVR